MKFNKSMLDEIELISLALENCQDFDIPAEDILDFQTSEIHTEKGRKEQTEIDDGRLVISKNAFKILSSDATEEYADGTKGIDKNPAESYYLYHRITYCCDICQVHVKFKDGKTIWFFVPYHPLESLLLGDAVDFSNCPSAELDENGDMLILFGKSSRAYKRTDNNYFDLIIGLKDAIKKSLDGTLLGQIEEFSNNTGDRLCPRLFIDMRLANKGLSGKYLSLVFQDVQNVSYKISFYEKWKRHLWMSRISTGEIFVEIEELCTFYCYGAEVNFKFLAKSDDSAKYENDEIYQKAMNCELNEREMELFAENHYANSEKDFNSKAFTAAKNKVLGGEISVKYFKYWLQAYSEMLQFYRGIHLKDNEFYKKIATMMDRLQIKLSYYEDLSDCRKLIESATEEIEIFYQHAQTKAD